MLNMIMIEAFSELDLDLGKPTQENQNADEDIVSMDSMDSIDEFVEMCIFESHCKSRLEK